MLSTMQQLHDFLNNNSCYDSINVFRPNVIEYEFDPEIELVYNGKKYLTDNIALVYPENTYFSEIKDYLASEYDPEILINDVGSFKIKDVTSFEIVEIPYFEIMEVS